MFPSVLCRTLVPLSWVYGMGVWMRRKMYEKRWLDVRQLPCPVFCVGNITAGGTGKTPLVIRLVRELQSMGRRPAVLSRGYGRSQKQEKASRGCVVVSDGSRVVCSVEEAGDEPFFLAKNSRVCRWLWEGIGFRQGLWP